MIALYTLPWLVLAAFLVVRVRLPRELPASAGGANGDPLPRVSVIVPARNEAVNIEACVRSLAGSRYPSFEIIVVDDRSDDGTGALAGTVYSPNAPLTVVQGRPLPEGWLGKPWACSQGAEAAGGDLLLFTDADTTHGADLLERAVLGLREDDADLLTVVGRQIMGSFWERVVQPQVFLTMVFRFFDIDATIRRGRWRDAIANGQFMLFTRSSYEELGGHEAVRDEVVEDLALAQHVMRSGFRLTVRRAEDDFATRMYRSLAELVRGWSKNIVLGGLQSVAPRLRPFVAPASLVVGVGLWLLPPVVLALALVGVLPGGPLLTWATLVVAVSVVLWMAVTWRMGASPLYGLLYPLGAVVGIYIFLRSWIRGRRVEWKGREYLVRGAAERV